MPANDSFHDLGLNLNETGLPVQIKGGAYLLGAEGELDGAALSLQFQFPGGTWADVQTFSGGSAVAIRTFKLPLALSPIQLPGGRVRCFISPGSSPKVSATLTKVG